MPHSRLLATITALCLFGGGVQAQSVFTFAVLQDIERLIVSKDCAGLRNYLAADPRLMAGSDPLARELRSFANGVDSGLIDCLSAALPPEPEPAAETIATALADPY